MILVINGHPAPESFSRSLAENYRNGALAAGQEVNLIHLAELKFDPNLSGGYRSPTPLEADLLRAQKLIRESHHLVFFYPQWWGSAPAILKGFIDRVFLPGFAFKYRGNSPYWDKLLTGRSAEIWLTADSPKFYFQLMYWNSPIRWLSKATLDYCGIKPVRTRIIDRVRFLNAAEIQKRLAAAERAGAAAPRSGGLRAVVS